ncbi:MULTISPECIES: malto-oligosyltrehalose trehalohydrolase [unclassified Pseudomonas]|uniref:malto-oligosyltrehalose trehalohydrolase n=1 Tax=unclassified Pseudomonas TaxID=196821 RepID=UPI000BC766FD|nr:MULTISPECIES: malto-oligosyltrehalose trehalohydrolase [unclassified Pseudomonas]PVZ13507.1 maltooligosyltrehalose trehalohydrolase [Pseudomonas sp. URIL14HWK12:I12]PVZ23813.1 maltooligosyltrehalose trehalohydrolase [Pseudomonas sp. URIL14HWK12:I10]PVZ33548.1 maltooligosyltrehalose trehalohydrolase [Pseudomonas sp. URIL14HWK12:I11]SNZ11986.1 maltooligosyl trehalose hydrolase [Pseudomonas sp. URIL14HWK12:I9]
MAVEQHEPWSHGAQRLPSGLVRFALWAPDADNVSVIFDEGASVPMQPQEGGWFSVETPCPERSAYRYHVKAADGQAVTVPDPAARAQAGDVQGPSLVVEPDNYVWRHNHWHGRPWHEAVIYELHVGALGGFDGVREHLPRLAAMGITAIELMPIAEFSGARNWGYDGVLPYAAEASYGTPEQLKQLIDTAHGHGLMVLLDVVYNHFGPDGNYLHAYASSFFREDQHTPWGAAIDFRKRPVRDFFIDNALMWLFEYRFDGLRFDAVHAIEDNTFLQELAQRIRQHTPHGRHIWLNLENEHNQAQLLRQGYDAQWNDDGHNVLHVLLTGETEHYYADYEDQTVEKLARCLSEGFVFQGHQNRHGKARGEPSGHLSPQAFVLFLQNHDQIGNRAFGERLARLCPAPALRAATTLLLTSPMIPLMFMGDEWAAEQPFQFFTDFHGELAEAVRNGRRSEFKDFSAFQDPEQRAKIPDPNAEATFEASRPRLAQFESQQNGPWVSLYRELLTLRRRELFHRLPGSRSLGCKVIGSKAVSARWRLGDGSGLQIDLNLGEEAVKCELPFPTCRMFDSREGATDTAALDKLPAYCALVSLLPREAAEAY